MSGLGRVGVGLGRVEIGLGSKTYQTEIGSYSFFSYLICSLGSFNGSGPILLGLFTILV